MYRWTRLSSQKWEDVWTERLQFLDPGTVMMLTWPESRALKIEAFCDKKTATALVQRFGGRATKLAAQVWTGVPDKPRAPLSIRGKLHIFSDEASWKKSSAQVSAICIPAGMAFGTGDHDTTATCLRLLTDLAPTLAPGWSAIDAGTGSGILAIAAEKLGATRVDALDFDPVCVRIGRENARTNQCRRVHFAKADARILTAFPSVQLVLANLFSELLLESAPGFAKKLTAAGWLIFSGVLRRQSDEVAAGLIKAGFEPPRVIARGKWCAGITRLSTKSRRPRHPFQNA